MVKKRLSFVKIPPTEKKKKEMIQGFHPYKKSHKIIAHHILYIHDAGDLIMVDDTEQGTSSKEVSPSSVGLCASHLQNPLLALVDGRGAEHGDPVGLLHFKPA